MTITQRHLKAAKNLGKSKTEAEAFEKAGYSPNYAKTGEVKKTKGWQELMEKELPDKMLLKVHKEGLKAKNKRAPDFAVRHKYLDTAYKIKKKTDEGPNIHFKFEGVNIKVQK